MAGVTSGPAASRLWAPREPGIYVFPSVIIDDFSPFEWHRKERKARGWAPDLTKRVITYVATPEPLTKRQRRRLRGKAKGRG